MLWDQNDLVKERTVLSKDRCVISDKQIATVLSPHPLKILYQEHCVS
jgi:hypothetical protein